MFFVRPSEFITGLSVSNRRVAWTLTFEVEHREVLGLYRKRPPLQAARWHHLRQALQAQRHRCGRSLPFALLVTAGSGCSAAVRDLAGKVAFAPRMPFGERAADYWREGDFSPITGGRSVGKHYSVLAGLVGCWLHVRDPRSRAVHRCDQKTSCALHTGNDLQPASGPQKAVTRAVRIQVKSRDRSRGVDVQREDATGARSVEPRELTIRGTQEAERRSPPRP